MSLEQNSKLANYIRGAGSLLELAPPAVPSRPIMPGLSRISALGLYARGYRDLGDGLRKLLEAFPERHPSAPLPPPQILAAYNTIIPGAAKDMHDLVIAKANHDMEMDRLAMGAQAQDQQASRAQFKRGQWLAFFLTLVLIGCGTGSILTGHDWAGATIIVGAVGALVLAFMWGRKPGGSPEGRPEDEARSAPPQS